ncbi:uncharacterized protein BJ171DRAFT_422673 [Polychytrium aggregatum]|uniref:uncharacterized protein n=1 Tax=Polychytrium aggregatum TaxID=110093 RepID=UPI0022FDEDA9|nr:uncharacterized protein BJ171DRAFT_422673 [Polychytrium aggregatum]KAI9205745.1 hypothetical protein BJ171DRAFT_422673 [Polychytrium aggregatum]
MQKLKDNVRNGLTAVSTTLHTPLPESLEEECRKAASILEQFIPRNNEIDAHLIPMSVLENARGVAVLTIVKAGFVWSGRGGAGLVVARLPDGRWSAPSAIAAGGAGFGAQIGAQITDCVFILNTDDAVRAFFQKGNLTFGGNLSIAAGPVGRSTEAAATGLSLAPIYSYSKSKGLFAGLSLEGSAIVARNEANSRFYNRAVNPLDLANGTIEPPAMADPLYRALNRRFGEERVLAPSARGIKAYAQLGRSFTAKGAQQGAQASPSQSFGGPSYGSAHDDRLSSEYDAKSATSPGSEPMPAYTPALPPRTGTLQSSQPRAMALFDYDPEQEGDLGFKKGDIITITESSGNVQDWWTGRIGERQGQFPANYVRMM